MQGIISKGFLLSFRSITDLLRETRVKTTRDSLNLGSSSRSEYRDKTEEPGVRIYKPETARNILDTREITAVTAIVGIVAV